MPDLHPGRIPEFVKSSRVEPGSAEYQARLAAQDTYGVLAAKRLTQNGPMRPRFTGSGVKDLGRIAAGR